MLAGLLSGRSRNRPSGRPSADRRADFGAFTVAVQPKSSPEGRFPSRKALLRNIEHLYSSHCGIVYMHHRAARRVLTVDRGAVRVQLWFNASRAASLEAGPATIILDDILIARGMYGEEQSGEPTTNPHRHFLGLHRSPQICSGSALGASVHAVCGPVSRAVCGVGCIFEVWLAPGAR
jgi:hypothetical protein